MERTLFLSLGSNLGNRHQNLIEAIKILGKQFIIHQKSSIYETTPHKIKSESLFLNQVLECLSKEFTNPFKLLDYVLHVENKVGRHREKNSPDRIIDIDILYWGDLVLRDDPFIPHPRLHMRKFVLKPLNDIAPKFVHPLFGETQDELLRKLM